MVTELDQAVQFESTLRAPAEKGTAQYTQWLSKLWKETAKLRNQETRRFLNPCRAHLEVVIIYQTHLEVVIICQAHLEVAVTCQAHPEVVVICQVHLKVVVIFKHTQR